MILRDISMPMEAPALRTPAQKLRSIILSGPLEFRRTPLSDVVNFLEGESRRLDVDEFDPAHKGVAIEIEWEPLEKCIIPGLPGESACKVSLTFTDAALGDVLDYLAREAGLEVLVTGTSVILHPSIAVPAAKPAGRGALARLKRALKAARRLLGVAATVRQSAE